MPAHATACIIHLFMLLMVSRFDNSAHFPRVKTFCFSLKNYLFVLVVCTMIYSARCCLDVLSNTARASLRYNKFRFTLRVGKNWKGKKELINHKIAQKWSSYYDLFRVEKYTHLERKKPLKYIFVMIVFVYNFFATWVFCLFTWNVIVCLFLWTWSCFSNFSWWVKRPITFGWRCLQKRYRGRPSTLRTL